MEHILQKLGVENRTAAALLVQTPSAGSLRIDPQASGTL
jgi:hypothetical protein